MQVVGVSSLWIYILLFTSLHCWTSSSSLPPPTLTESSRSVDSVVLVCRAPEGQRGTQFKLFKNRTEVDSLDLQVAAEEVRFTVRVQVQVQDQDQDQLFCCFYRDQAGISSPFSQYWPTHNPGPGAPSPPAPVLSVNSSSGLVNRGATLTFSCSVPGGSRPQSQSQSGSGTVNFLLLRDRVPVPRPRALGSGPEPQPGVFRVGPLRGGDGGHYSCLYQITKRRGLKENSTISNTLTITVTDGLPVPVLTLELQSDVWGLQCCGSASYPGALFHLHLEDSDPPVSSLRAPALRHQVHFQVPVQDSPLVLYRCSYDVLLRDAWRTSEKSLPLAVTKGSSPPSSSSAVGVDWPLVLGSFSAVVLFLCSVLLVSVIAHRKVKAVAEEKKKREQAQFWTKVHAKDHVVDLTLRRSSFCSQDWASGDTESRSTLWNSHSTFTTPIHPEF